RLALPSAQKRFPEHDEDRDLKRNLAAYDSVDALLKGLEKVSASWVPTLLGRNSERRDLIDALTLARAEIGLTWFNSREQCRLMKGEKAPSAQLIVQPPGAKPEEDEDDRNEETLRAQIEVRKEKVWRAIQETAKSIDALKPEERLTPLRRQVAMGFLQRISPNKDCLERTLELGQKLYLTHPNDAEIARVFAGLMESRALTSEDDTILDRVRLIYERMVDIGDDKMDLFALSRLALVKAAWIAQRGVQQPDYVGPNPDNMRYLTRA